MQKFHLVLLIHAHQPVGNFDDVMERTYQRSYLPFVECLARHPRARLGLHYSGSLLEWLAEHHPEYLGQIRALIDRGQVEVVGGGFYEPILITIPHEDQIEQILRLSKFIETHFARRPAGAWLAERVWEPQLPMALSEAGMAYTLVDDSHFLTAGREMHELFGYYIAEDRGATVKIIPGLQELRYLLPFGSTDDAVAFLRRSSEAHPGAMAAMGDDMEKFGGWPHTWEHCYRDGWLDRFFSAIEASSGWLDMIPPAEALANRPALGRVDLPTASYTEMMEWVLPTPVRRTFHGLLDEFQNRPDVRRFLRGGFWRGFFSKYAEANLLHKKMLRVSSKLRADTGRIRKGSAKAAEREKAFTHLLRSQANDAYWHGIFGGLYAPHLRTVLWRELVRAETIADEFRIGSKSYQAVSRLDFDADGREEIEIVSPQFAAVVKPSCGGTLEVLDFRPSAVTLINSMQRREEAYHSRLLHPTQAGGGAVSIHNQTLVKEPGLEKYLKYDRWPRTTFRLLLFAAGKTHADYAALRLDESAEFAGGDYEIGQVSPHDVELALRAPLHDALAAAGQQESLQATKRISFDQTAEGFTVTCSLALSKIRGDGTPPGVNLREPFQVGVETVLNLLAPNVPDRYFEFSGERKPLQWSGIVPGPRVRLADEWQNVAVELEARGAAELWVAPIETVSESEEGFERVYQGSQILGVWTPEFDTAGKWSANTVLKVSAARKVISRSLTDARPA